MLKYISVNISSVIEKNISMLFKNILHKVSIIPDFTLTTTRNDSLNSNAHSNNGKCEERTRIIYFY